MITRNIVYDSYSKKRNNETWFCVCVSSSRSNGISARRRLGKQNVKHKYVCLVWKKKKNLGKASSKLFPRERSKHQSPLRCQFDAFNVLASRLYAAVEPFCGLGCVWIMAGDIPASLQIFLSLVSFCKQKSVPNSFLRQKSHQYYLYKLKKSIPIIISSNHPYCHNQSMVPL